MNYGVFNTWLKSGRISISLSFTILKEYMRYSRIRFSTFNDVNSILYDKTWIYYIADY